MYSVISMLKPTLKGYCTPNLKLACFVSYLKIINNSLKNNEECKLSKDLENSTEILVDQEVFKGGIGFFAPTFRMDVLSVTKYVTLSVIYDLKAYVKTFKKNCIIWVCFFGSGSHGNVTRPLID